MSERVEGPGFVAEKRCGFHSEELSNLRHDHTNGGIAGASSSKFSRELVKRAGAMFAPVLDALAFPQPRGEMADNQVPSRRT